MLLLGGEQLHGNANFNWIDISGELLANRGISQTIGFRVIFAWNVGDGKIQRPGQLSANPIQRVKSRAPAGIDSGHLPHYDFRIGVHMKRLRF